MLDDLNLHTENGLAQDSIMSLSGYKITVSIATGVCGESSCICVYDHNVYGDDDDRGNRPKEYIIPLDSVDDLKKLQKLIKKTIKQRNLTLIK